MSSESDDSGFMWDKTADTHSSSSDMSEKTSKSKIKSKHHSNNNEDNLNCSNVEKTPKRKKKRHKSDSSDSTETSARPPKKLKLDPDSSATTNKHERAKIKHESDDSDGSDHYQLLQRKVKQEEEETLAKSRIKIEKDAAINGNNISFTQKELTKKPSFTDNELEREEPEATPTSACKRSRSHTSHYNTDTDNDDRSEIVPDKPSRKRKRKDTIDEKKMNGVIIQSQLSIGESEVEERVINSRIQRYAKSRGLQAVHHAGWAESGEVTAVRGAGRTGLSAPPAAVWLPDRGLVVVPAVRAQKRAPRPPTSYVPLALPPAPPAAMPPPSHTRHPLLGRNYRRLMRLQASVRARLHPDPSTSPAPVIDPPKKRKKAKRQKDLWDSETAIEKNLFNF